MHEIMQYLRENGQRLDSEIAAATRMPLRKVRDLLTDLSAKGKIADQVFEAIKEKRFYILTHPEWTQVIQMRVDNLVRADNPRSVAETVMKIVKLSK